jgi:hypothetical protein
MVQPEGSVIEICFVVSDIDAAIEQFGKFWGAGPFFTADMRFLEGHKYRGEAAPLQIIVGFGFCGGLLIELVQPLDGDRSVFSEALGERGTSFHHIVRREDFEAGYDRMTAMGFPVALESKTVFGERAVLFDTKTHNGAFIEVTDLNITFKPLIAVVSEAHRNWDGSDPRRPLAPLFDYAAPLPA